MFNGKDLYLAPNALAAHYGRFRVTERLLLTGHSHQAWPDCGFDGQKQAWLDAAEFVDDKWERAFAKADRVKRGFATLLHDEDGEYALAGNTHELVIRFLSALPLKTRPRLVTTDGEYHSIRRQLDRLAEVGVEVVKVPAHPAATVAERIAYEVDDRTSAALVSSVYYQNGHIAQDLSQVMDACRRIGAELLVDAYHAVNVVPFSVDRDGLNDAFIVGGGYKYCQLGEGNCFLRIPNGCAMRPVVTGWFSEFRALANAVADQTVAYGRGGDRFAGSTYDPTSHYRASAVFDFLEENDLTPAFLREVSQHQVERLAEKLDGLDADSAIITRDRSVPLTKIAGFLAVTSPVAGEISAGLRDRGVFTDYRGNVLRLGPAPYLSDEQLDESIALLGETIQTLS